MTKEKILINSVIVALIALTAWAVWSGVSKKEAPESAGEQSNVIEGDARIEIVNFQDRAMELVNAPVVFRSEFPDQVRKDLERQIKDLQEKIRADYDDLAFWISFGQLKKVIGDYEGARDAWEFASLISPLNSLSFHNLGDLYGYFLNNFELAEENYLQSIKNDPENVNAYINLADLYWQSGRADAQSAIPDLLLGGIENNSKLDYKLSLMARLAKHYADAGENQEAIRYYREILKLDATYADVINAEIERLKNF